jgi:hypothetical protein
MDRLCVDRFRPGLSRNDCYFYANGFYQAVRGFGEGSFD